MPYACNDDETLPMNHELKVQRGGSRNTSTAEAFKVIDLTRDRVNEALDALIELDHQDCSTRVWEAARKAYADLHRISNELSEL